MTTYFIERWFRVLGTKQFTFIERDSNRTGLLNTAQDIASGEVENVTKIIGVDLESGRSWDATDEVAQEVFDICISDYNAIPDRLRDWIDVHVGLRAEAAE